MKKAKVICRSRGLIALALSSSRRSVQCLGLLGLLVLATSAQAQYERPVPGEGEQPTAADLELYDGASRTLTVQLLNLTPYDIEFEHRPGETWSITAADESSMQDTWSVLVNKSFMFAPVGVPGLIPRAPEQNFVSPYLPDGVTTNPDYDPDYVDTTTHPYPMLFSWDDRGGFVVDNWVKWTIRDVRYTWCDDSSPIEPDCDYRYQDVDLGLWMYRNKPTRSLSSSFLPVLVKSLNVVFKTLMLPVNVANPAAWIKEFLAIEKLVDSSIDFAKANTQENDGNKMWVASYVIPDASSLCVLTGFDCTPSTMVPADTGDAVYSLWPAQYAGPSPDGSHGPSYAAEAQLVVSVHVFRGQKAKQCDPVYYPKKCPLGSEPVVMITVMQAADFAVGAMASENLDLTLGSSLARDNVSLFLRQAGAGKIRALLKKEGRPGLHVLRSIISQLDPDQEQVLMRMMHTMASGRLPTREERQLVHVIAKELQARLK